MRSFLLARLGCVYLLAAAFSLAAVEARSAEGPKGDRWEPAIARFEAQDRQKPPPKQGILFVGSSSIVGWNLAKYFPELPVINRGFGGSQIADSVRYAERIVLPYEPKIIVFYAGDNDIAGGKSPEQVHADYQAFVKKVHQRLPQTRIVFISIKPSPSRWKLVEKMRHSNALIKAMGEGDSRLVYVDVDRPMIGADGQPRGELFKPDKLHLNDEGYKLWSDLVRPQLK